MFKIIENLPDNVLGIEVHGKLTHKDYADGFIPLFDARLEKQKPMKVLCVIESDFEGIELAAMWDDTAYGIKHWRDISHMAMVCDLGWIKSMMAIFSPFYPGEIRSYNLFEVAQAKKWICKPESLAA